MKIRITPSMAWELRDREMQSEHYEFLRATDWKPGTYDVPESVIDELQSWSSYEIGTANENMGYADREERLWWMKRANSARALFKQTVALIGHRHSIG